jgi:hypothetical protein
MTLDSDKIAERLGATHVAPVPDVGGGAFGMAHLAQKLKDRLDARGARRPGTGVGWILGSKVPMSPETEKLLIALAETLSTPEHRVNPLQLAGKLLEESVQKLAQEKTP